MGERELIASTDAPRTRASLAADLRALGVAEGSVLLAHSSLSRLGWVAGGAVAVVQALLDALGPEGTLVVPTHTTGNSEPSHWRNPPVPEAWWPVLREHMPAFDPRVTPARGIGAIPEVARVWPGALRSDHPQMSFAALGPDAGRITRGHVLESGLGDGSPLARVYDLDGHVLLLGVGHARNTPFHLAEYRRPRPRPHRTGAAVQGAAGREWVEFEDIEYDSDDFDALGGLRGDGADARRTCGVGGVPADAPAGGGGLRGGVDGGAPAVARFVPVRLGPRPRELRASAGRVRRRRASRVALRPLEAARRDSASARGGIGVAAGALGAAGCDTGGRGRSAGAIGTTPRCPQLNAARTRAARRSGR